MARQNKETVDYFPHFCKHGRTITILEDRFKNDGYAFWFKLLEILGQTEGHAYDCSNASNWAYLKAHTHTDEETANGILSLLLDLGKIDKELWEARRVIWVKNFVNNLTQVYRKRVEALPQRPDFSPQKEAKAFISDTETPSMDNKTASETDKGKKRKEKERKYPYQGICDLWNEICFSLPKIAKITERRKQEIRNRLEEWSTKTGKADTACERTEEAWLQEARRLFTRVQASDFLTGRTPNKTGWTATFDWLFNSPNNFVKLTEGNYDNKKNGAQDAQHTLGVGEFIDGTGKRTYGSGRANIPLDASPRPSERHQWDAGTKRWILL